MEKIIYPAKTKTVKLNDEEITTQNITMEHNTDIPRPLALIDTSAINPMLDAIDMDSLRAMLETGNIVAVFHDGSHGIVQDAETPDPLEPFRVYLQCDEIPEDFELEVRGVIRRAWARALRHRRAVRHELQAKVAEDVRKWVKDGFPGLSDVFLPPKNHHKVDTSNPKIYPKEDFLPFKMALVNGHRPGCNTDAKKENKASTPKTKSYDEEAQEFLEKLRRAADHSGCVLVTAKQIPRSGGAVPKVENPGPGMVIVDYMDLINR